MIAYTGFVYPVEAPSTVPPLNDAYRKLRGTHKPFTATQEQANAAWCELNADEIAKAAENRRQAARFAARLRKGGFSDDE